MSATIVAARKATNAIVYHDATVLVFLMDFIVKFDVCFAGRRVFNVRLLSGGRLCNEATTV
jgi:hypothetical protein